MFGDSDSKSNLRGDIMAYLSGVIFATGWWLWIDAHAWVISINGGNNPTDVTFWHYVPGIVSTLAILLINAISWDDLGGMSFSPAFDDVQGRVRVWFFLSLVIGFSGIIAAIWIGVEHWLSNADAKYTWPGIVLIFQNVLIFISAVLLRFSRPMKSSQGVF